MKRKYKVIIGVVGLVGILVAYLFIQITDERSMFASAEKKVNLIMSSTSAYATQTKTVKSCKDTTFIYSKGGRYCEYRLLTQLQVLNEKEIVKLISTLRNTAQEQGWIFIRDNTPTNDNSIKKILVFKQSKLDCVIEVSTDSKTNIGIGCGGMSSQKIY